MWERAVPNTATSSWLCKLLNVFINNFVRWDNNKDDQKIGDGIVQDTSGDVIFTVKFKAITCRPLEQEVLDGTIQEVGNSGFSVRSGAINCFIGLKVNHF